MNINNPFESGHIKNYVLLYVSIVVIMVLFFIASTLFHDVQDVEKKTFKVDTIEKVETESLKQSKELRFKLMDKAY
ncbi:MAG: hypothetical protein Q9M32_08310 [Sulfurimonas sp.]|nr:hypothetical protein [Sulfurimonas sp.]MDQ7062097.1 hypothetical protein [Sulfurimonas sp.]